MINVISNIVYPIAGYFGDWITFSAGILLCIGSALMHYQEEYGERKEWAILLDWIGMYAYFLSIIAFHTTPWVLLILPFFLGLGHDMRNNILISIVVVVAIIVGQAWWSLLVFLLAVSIRFKWEHTKHQDYSHAVWHLLTGKGSHMIIV